VKRTVIRRNEFRRACCAAAVVLAVAALSGCSGSAGNVREKSAKEWYDEGQALAAKKKYDEAVTALKEATKGYRSADLDADIQLALADARFAQEEYAAAVESYSEFLRLHPHNTRADYAQYRVGAGYLKQMRSCDRSPDAARKAAEAFSLLLRTYPRSGLLAQGQEGLTAARRRLADHELYVAEFYRRQGSYAAAAGRYELVLREYGDLGYADEALYRLGRCYQSMSQADKAAQQFEQLRREHPQSRFIKELGDQKG
jgi:outer membrane protein assembly factor BamD